MVATLSSPMHCVGYCDRTGRVTVLAPVQQGRIRVKVFERQVDAHKAACELGYSKRLHLGPDSFAADRKADNGCVPMTLTMDDLVKKGWADFAVDSFAVNIYQGNTFERVGSFVFNAATTALEADTHPPAQSMGRVADFR